MSVTEASLLTKVDIVNFKIAEPKIFSSESFHEILYGISEHPELFAPFVIQKHTEGKQFYNFAIAKILYPEIDIMNKYIIGISEILSTQPNRVIESAKDLIFQVSTPVYKGIAGLPFSDTLEHPHLGNLEVISQFILTKAAEKRNMQLAQTQ